MSNEKETLPFPRVNLNGGSFTVRLSEQVGKSVIPAGVGSSSQPPRLGFKTPFLQKESGYLWHCMQYTYDLTCQTFCKGSLATMGIVHIF